MSPLVSAGADANQLKKLYGERVISRNGAAPQGAGL
jgi:hypothetical protein